MKTNWQIFLDGLSLFKTFGNFVAVLIAGACCVALGNSIVIVVKLCWKKWHWFIESDRFLRNYFLMSLSDLAQLADRAIDGESRDNAAARRYDFFEALAKAQGQAARINAYPPTDAALKYVIDRLMKMREERL